MILENLISVGESGSRFRHGLQLKGRVLLVARPHFGFNLQHVQLRVQLLEVRERICSGLHLSDLLDGDETSEQGNEQVRGQLRRHARRLHIVCGLTDGASQPPGRNHCLRTALTNTSWNLHHSTH